MYRIVSYRIVWDDSTF